MFERLRDQPPDGLLALIRAVASDPRPGKVDLGVGVYRDAGGATPVMRAVKGAERVLLETQDSKGYLGPEGDVGYVAALRPVVFGPDARGDRLVGIQTPGGTGALRLGGELVRAAAPGARVWIGSPSWPNHAPIFAAAGLAVRAHAQADLAAQDLDFAAVTDALSRAERGDLVLLHGCCHNPTGMDFSAAQWREIAGLLARRGLVPFIDLAYQGLGTGLEADAAPTRLILDAVDRALVAYSCDKNFGLYRERVGALYVQCANGGEAGRVRANLNGLARVNWSMPPDHGAAIVRTILERPELAAEWRAELVGMCARIAGNRAALAAAHPALGFVRRQSGLFSNLALTRGQAQALRANHAVYVTDSGRINLAGMQPGDAGAIVRALEAENCLAGAVPA